MDMERVASVFNPALVLGVPGVGPADLPAPGVEGLPVGALLDAVDVLKEGGALSPPPGAAGKKAHDLANVAKAIQATAKRLNVSVNRILATVFRHETKGASYRFVPVHEIDLSGAVVDDSAAPYAQPTKPPRRSPRAVDPLVESMARGAAETANDGTLIELALEHRRPLVTADLLLAARACARGVSAVYVAGERTPGVLCVLRSR